MRFLLYIVIFLVILILSNYVYTSTKLYEKDIIKCNADLVYKFDSSYQDNDIIYFGESSNFTFSEKDSIKKSISELVSEFNSNYKILTISKGAIHAKTFKTIIERIPDVSTIKAIIVTVNLRSFGINWIQSNLESNLSRANIIYKNYPPILKKLLISFKAYDNKEPFQRKEIIKQHYKKDKFNLRELSFETVADWDKELYNKGILNSDGTKNQAETDVACHFVKNYAFALTENNPRVNDLDEIVKICRKKNIKLIFNLLPENYERCRLLCGIDLEILMRTNVLFLKNRYDNEVAFSDNFYLLHDDNFIDREWPTEHYNYSGRRLVAKGLHEVLKQTLHLK